MRAMVKVDLEDPLILGGMLISIWILVGVGIEAILFNGDLLQGAIFGALGGLGFTVVFLYFRQRQEEK